MTTTETPKLNKDELYRLRHPERVKESFRKHYAKNADVINEKRREKRRLFKEALTKEFDPHNSSQTQNDADVSHAASCSAACAPDHHGD